MLGFISYLVNAFYIETRSVLQRSEDGLCQLIQPLGPRFTWLVLVK